MKIPRDLSGRQFAQLLRRFGYEISRQEGSHIRLVSNRMGRPQYVTVPDHSELKIGTLRALIRLVAEYLELDPAELMGELFER